jgi:hypothetical protein
VTASQRPTAHQRPVDFERASRAATFGAVAVLLLDIDAVVPGQVDDEGRVEFSDEASAKCYGLVDEIAARALLSGALVLGVRRADVPGEGSLAAILRYPF